MLGRNLGVTFVRRCFRDDFFSKTLFPALIESCHEKAYPRGVQQQMMVGGLKFQLEVLERGCTRMYP